MAETLELRATKNIGRITQKSNVSARELELRLHLRSKYLELRKEGNKEERAVMQDNFIQIRAAVCDMLFGCLTERTTEESEGLLVKVKEFIMTLGELVVVLCHKEDQLIVEEMLKCAKEYLDMLVSDRNIDAGTLSEIRGFLDKSWKLFESMEVNCDVGAKPLITD